MNTTLSSNLQATEYKEWSSDNPPYLWFIQIYGYVFSIAFFCIWVSIMLDKPMRSIQAKKIPLHRYITFTILLTMLPFIAICNVDADFENSGLGDADVFVEKCGTEGNIINAARGALFKFSFGQIFSSILMAPPVRCYKNASFGDWRGPLICNAWIILFGMGVYAFADAIRAHCDLSDTHIGRSYFSICLYETMHLCLVFWRFAVYFYYDWDIQKIETYWFQGLYPENHPGMDNLVDNDTIELEQTDEQTDSLPRSPETPASFAQMQGTE